MNDALHETSFTETTQEIMLAVIAAPITASMISWVVSVKEVSCSASFIQATSI
jgi:hypothetical protein